MKKLFQKTFDFILSPVKDASISYNIEDNEIETEKGNTTDIIADNGENEDYTLLTSSYPEKCDYAITLLKEKYRNFSLAEKYSEIIDSCETHKEKYQLVRVFIEDFDKVPLELNDQLEADNLTIKYQMESLAATHLSFIESLVTKIVRRYQWAYELADYFTRVVYAEPSIFSSEKERAYALFRGAWLFHDLSNRYLEINWCLGKEYKENLL